MLDMRNWSVGRLYSHIKSIPFHDCGILQRLHARGRTTILMWCRRWRLTQWKVEDSNISSSTTRYLDLRYWMWCRRWRLTQWKVEDPNISSSTTRYLDLRYWILQKLVYNDALFSEAVRVHKLFYEIIIEIMIGAGPWLESLFHLYHFRGMIACTISRIGDATTLPIRRRCLKAEYVKIPTANALLLFTHRSSDFQK